MNFLFGYFSSGHFALHLLSYKIVRNQGSWLQPVEAFGFIVRGHIKIHNKCYCPQLCRTTYAAVHDDPGGLSVTEFERELSVCNSASSSYLGSAFL